MASDWEPEDPDVPQNPEELMWYRPSLCPQSSSPSLFSGPEQDSDGEVSVIPPTPERSQPAKTRTLALVKNLFKDFSSLTR